MNIFETMKTFEYKVQIEYKEIKATEKIREAYGVFSTPSLYLMNNESRKISGLPENMEQLKGLEPLF